MTRAADPRATGHRHRSLPVVRPGAWAAAALVAAVSTVTSAQAADLKDLLEDSYASERILVPDEMWVSGNAAAWVMMAFGKACLRQGWSEDLAETVLPEGYTVTGSTEYLFGTASSDVSPESATVVLTRSGSEEADWTNGTLAVRLGKPSDADADGICSAEWSRGREGGAVWKDERWAESWAVAAPDLAWGFERHLSHKLKGFLASPPEWPIAKDGPQSTVQTWNVECYAGRCEVESFFLINRDEVAISLKRSRAL